MLYFLWSTSKCNLRCEYCGNDPKELPMPIRPTYTLDSLRDFLEQDSDPIIVFYGGEPLVNLNFVMKVMDKFPSATFVLQTNATLLHQLPADHLKRFKCILVSIDGRPATYDAYRGRGTYDRVIASCRDARARGFAGSMVARMTCSTKSDIYKDVSHILKDEACSVLFDHVYWQLDVGFDCPMNIRWGDFELWVRDSYKPGIQRLVEEWTAEFEETGVVRGIVPFLCIARSLWRRERERPELAEPLRCGIGHSWSLLSSNTLDPRSAFSITTDGSLIGCPCAAGEDWNTLGSIAETKPSALPGRLEPAGMCDASRCDIRWLCGGRCLYANKTMWWGEDGYAHVCETVRCLADAVGGALPRLGAAAARAGIAVLDAGASPFCWPYERYSLEGVP